MPFPMAGEPQHAAAEAPVAGSARHDHAVELVLAHLVAQRRVAARIFLLRELLVDRVPVIRRVAHVGERQRLVEARAHLLPGLVSGGTRRLDVHGRSLELARGLFGKPVPAAVKSGAGVFRNVRQSLQLPMLTGPPAASTASLARAKLATCSTVGFLSLLDVAVLDAVVDRPCGALGIEAAVDRPDAVLGQHVDGVFDRLLRLLGRLLR